jgi:hypothetical protein
VISLAKAAVYGGGAALAGSALYATVAIATGYEIGLIAIAVGWMVGRAIRHGSGGLGGRPQQILAVALTYFSITSGYIPVYIHQWSKAPPASQASTAADQKAGSEAVSGEPLSPAAAILFLLLLAAAAPFLSLGSGLSGVIGLVIVYIGLSQAWRLTGRGELLVMGPYERAAGPESAAASAGGTPV